MGGIVDGTGSLGAALGPLLVGLLSDSFVSASRCHDNTPIIGTVKGENFSFSFS